MAAANSAEMIVAEGVRVPRPDALFIGGEWRRSARGEMTSLISPVTEEPLAEVCNPTIEDADRALGVAADAFGGEWSRSTIEMRIAACRRFCALLEEQSDDIARAWAVEAGIAVRWGRTLHRYGAKVAWETALSSARQALAPETRQSPVGSISVEYEPVGLVVAIMPYNGPLPSIASKVVPALLAGSTVVVKAAPESALTMRIIAQCAVKAGFPAGVLSILAADLEVSQHLVRDPRVEMISFTGGPRGAAEILRQTADNLPRMLCELGGKSPAVLLDDANLGKALRIITAGATSGTGQVCAALSRILVPRSRHDEVVDALANHYRALRIGDPLSEQTDQGPLATRAAYQRTVDFVEVAKKQGAEIVAGGGRPPGFERGWFHEPTLLIGVGEEDVLAKTEVFGPVTVVLPYDDDEDAIRLANATEYGLAASVFTEDEQRGLSFARRIRAGSVALNSVGPSMAAPFGGVKRSGWGRECGPEGIREFTATKQILKVR